MTLKDLAAKDINFKNMNLHAMLPKRKMLNIEVGDRLTKVCVSVPKGKKSIIQTPFLFQTPKDAVMDGQVENPDALARELRKQLDGHGLGAWKSVTFSLTSSKVATREVTLPPVHENRLHDVIQTNAADYFPVDLSKYYVAHCLLEQEEKGEHPFCRVLAFAVPLQLLQMYFQLAEQTGLKIRDLDFSGNSQYQKLRLVRDDAVTMYVNLNCSSSCITFMKGGQLLLQRTFTFGVDETILHYMEIAGKQADDYLAALKECENQAYVQELSQDLSRMESDVVRCANYYNSSHWDQPVEKIVLFGIGSRLAGLKDMVAESTGLDVTLLEEIPGAECDTDEWGASVYLACAGSSLSPLDLIPPQIKTKKKLLRPSGGKSKAVYLREGLFICGACLVLSLILSGFAFFRYQSARAEKMAAEQEIAHLSYAETVYNDYKAVKSEEKSLQTLSTKIETPNDQLTELIEELETKMPSRILLLSASCTPKEVMMDITVPEYSDVAVVLTQLRSFESIQNIEFYSAVEEKDQSNGSYVSFSVVCTYGRNPYLNGDDPYAKPSEEKGKSSEKAESKEEAS
ncbi:MAG: pilus assembly protein PilM [Oscillospiraceae bacterium]|jgi:type IV pilus assembly protein PilM|nr:pilus assembly protein PilM [Oscillospiraceae bacterium]